MLLEALVNQTQIRSPYKYTNRSLAPNMLCMLLVISYESTAGADASVEALKLTLAYSSLLIALLAIVALHARVVAQRMGNDRRDRC